MDEIFFPAQYKKAILCKNKNTTIRVGKEMGKYKIGKIYLAKSYAGNDWGVAIKINVIVKTELCRLFEFGIPKRSIATIQKKEKISLNDKVESVKFSYV